MRNINIWHRAIYGAWLVFGFHLRHYVAYNFAPIHPGDAARVGPAVAVDDTRGGVLTPAGVHWAVVEMSKWSDFIFDLIFGIYVKK